MKFAPPVNLVSLPSSCEVTRLAGNNVLETWRMQIVPCVLTGTELKLVLDKANFHDPGKAFSPVLCKVEAGILLKGCELGCAD